MTGDQQWRGDATAVLDAKGLRKRFRKKQAVDGVALRVGAGERLGLLGPNGAGKTTTLLMLLGAVTPDEGSVEICGYKLPKQRSEAMAQVGFAAGYLPLAQTLRVREFLVLYARLYGVRRPQRHIDAALERFRITHLAGTLGTELSSGQRTLVGIVKATLHHPRLLVLDEPTASLDPDVALRVRRTLLTLCEEEGIALLVTSHNMAEVAMLCQRVVFLSRGRIAADGTPDEVVSRFGRDDLEGVFLHLAGDLADPDELEAWG